MKYVIAILALFMFANPVTAHPNYPGLERSSHNVQRQKVRHVKVKKVRKASVSAHRVKRKSVTVARRARPVAPVRIARTVEREVVQTVHSVERGTASVIRIASRYIGTNPTRMRRLWCANFIGMVERKAGRSGTGSNYALSYARYGKGVSLARARPGDIVVLKRRGGGHVGYYAGPGSRPGTVKLISGNTGGKRGARIVSAGNYPTKRIVAVRRVT